MDPKQILAQLRRSIASKYEERSSVVGELKQLRGQEAPDEDKVSEALARRAAVDAELEGMEQRAADLEAEIAENAAADERAKQARAAAEPAPSPEKRHAPAQVTPEATYREDRDPDGAQFLRDITQAHRGNTAARQRLDAHTQREFDLRKRDGAPVSERAVDIAAVGGFAIPQYLTDLYAPAAKAGAPFVENANKHPLPATGMTAYLSKISTATTVDEQATEGDTVDETDIDDTLLTVNLFTVAGSQSVSRQVIDRAPDALDVTVDDLMRSYYTDLDNKALNRATTGLTAAGTTATYTDASPTVQELYSKILGALSTVETTMLDQGTENMVLMHPRRWRWMMNQFLDTFPFIGGRLGTQSGEGYGSGIRGYLPSDDPVVTDANIATDAGAGTEDLVFVYNKREAHVWVDDNQPMMIKAEQTQSKKLLVDLVVYGYAATYFSRYSGAVQKITGTGLIAPTF